MSAAVGRPVQRATVTRHGTSTHRPLASHRCVLWPVFSRRQRLGCSAPERARARLCFVLRAARVRTASPKQSPQQHPQCRREAPPPHWAHPDVPLRVQSLGPWTPLLCWPGPPQSMSPLVGPSRGDKARVPSSSLQRHLGALGSPWAGLHGPNPQYQPSTDVVSSRNPHPAPVSSPSHAVHAMSKAWTSREARRSTTCPCPRQPAPVPESCGRSTEPGDRAVPAALRKLQAGRVPERTQRSPCC